MNNRWVTALVIAVALGLLGSVLWMNGYDTGPMGFTVLTGGGKLGIVLVGLSGLVAQYGIAGLAASHALRDRAVKLAQESGTRSD